MRHVLFVLALSACGPFLHQQSAPPPGRSARLDEVGNFWGLQYYRLEISEGVALALTCDDTGPCEKMNVVSENPAVAEVRPASLSALTPVGYTGTQQPAAAFVIVGKQPGQTKIHLKEKGGKRDVVVTVVAAPPPGNSQTAATAQK